jgi:hypothetical protein
VAYLSRAFAAHSAGWFRPPVSASPRRQAIYPLRLAARGQAGRVPDHRPQGRGRLTLWSRHGKNFTDRLPKIAEAVCSLAAKSALIDGEAVVVRADGHFDFAALRTKAGSARACLVAFDLLNLSTAWTSVSVQSRNGDPHFHRSSLAWTTSCSATS